MHLVLAQYSHSPGGTHEVSNIGAQFCKSIALALMEARKQKNSVVVISSNIASAQGNEFLDAAEFAELLKEVLLEDMVQNITEQFRCVFVAVQSLQQCGYTIVVLKSGRQRTIPQLQHKWLLQKRHQQLQLRQQHQSQQSIWMSVRKPAEGWLS
jgi:hypothetical protein